MTETNPDETTCQQCGRRILPVITASKVTGWVHANGSTYRHRCRPADEPQLDPSVAIVVPRSVAQYVVTTWDGCIGSKGTVVAAARTALDSTA